MAVIRDYRHLVDHTSLLDVNERQQTKLEVYEYVEAPHNALDKFGPVVLMVHGRSQNSNAVFGQWAGHLADQGIHVFTMNVEGFGSDAVLPSGSARPSVMDDPFNANRNDFPKLYSKPVNPPPLSIRPYTYPRWLSDTTSELAGLWAVLNWITTKTDQPSHLIGYSAGAFLAGPTAMLWPDIVESLFLAAPVFPPEGLSTKPTVDPKDQSTWPHYLKTAFGFPFNIQAKAEMKAAWEDDQAVGAEMPVASASWPAFVDGVWKGWVDQDPKGADWGANVGGVLRFPTRLWWGWNEDTVKSDAHLGNDVPVCIVYGSSDTQVITRKRDPITGAITADPVIDAAWVPNPVLHPGPPFSVTRLYADITGPSRGNKLMVTVPKTGHLFQWEKCNTEIFDYTADWIHSGGIKGHKTGSYTRDPSGVLV